MSKYDTDLINRKFGYLVVIKKDTQKDKNGRAKWICECTACGNIVSVPRQRLIVGDAKSCGCRFRKPQEKNNIDYTGKTLSSGIKIVKRISGTGCSTIWECICPFCNAYFNLMQQNLLKQVSCGCKKRKESANKVGDYTGKLDNTCVSSLIHADTMYKSNTSGVRGVHKLKGQNKYTANITFKGKTYHLGTFYSLEDATQARKIAEDKLYGDFLQWYASEYPDKWGKFKNKDNKNDD